ncbi:hypothetical protein FACS1894163_09320 [Spirochaetia bacterium]|nr:hypothetical protein FACS1894163_09320 [Spirochaetia bacterium]
MKMLQPFIDAGFRLTPCFKLQSGGYGFVDYQNWTRDTAELTRFWGSGHRIWAYRPADIGLTAFDLDRHPDKPDGVDGWFRMLYKAFAEFRKPIPDELRDIEMHPCYIETPGNGFHLFFRGAPLVVNKKRLGPGIDVRPDGGSGWLYTGVKEKGPYRLNGSFDRVPDIPVELVKYLEYQIYVPPRWRIFKTGGAELLERARWAAELKHGSENRNKIILHLATAAAFGDVPQEETLSFIQADSLLASHDRTTETVRRAYRYAAGK